MRETVRKKMGERGEGEGERDGEEKDGGEG